MLHRDARAGTNSGRRNHGTSLSRKLRRGVRHIAFYLSSTATAVWRRGPRGCWSSLRRLGGGFRRDTSTATTTTSSTRSTAFPLWMPFAGTRRRLSSSMEFLEQFRHGPETQSEWNLLLWRVTFPMIALVIFTLLAVLGKFGHRVYSFLVCPVWYFSQFVLVAHPFLLVFKFTESDATIRRRTWHGLALLSVAISVMEWFLSSPPDTSPARRSYTRLGPSAALVASIRAKFLRHSWIVANTVFGVLVLVVIPRYFYKQTRTVARDRHGMRDASTASTMAATLPSIRASPSATTLFIPLSPGLPAAAAASPPRASDDARSDPFQDDADFRLTPPSSSSGSSRTGRSRSSSSSSNRPYSSIIVTSSGTAAASVSSSAAALAACKRRTRAVFLLTASCAVLVWIAMFSSYNSIKPVEIISKYWFTVYLVSPIVCALLIYVLRENALGGPRGSPSLSSSVSFDFVAIYSVLIVHLPVFLGHLCFRLFTIIELADPAHPAHAEARGIEFAQGATGSGSGVNFSASTSWMKLGISVVFLLVMQTYFFAMTQVVNAMAEPFAHPSLLYLGQLYYYLFWYVLVGSDTPIDALYWGMLLVNNIHIAFLNTGIYADVKQSSSRSCFALSTLFSAGNANVFRGGASMVMCLRATTLTVANATSAAVCRGAISREHEEKTTRSRSKKRERQTNNTRVTGGGMTSGEDDDANGTENVFATGSDAEDVEAGGIGGPVYRPSRRSHISLSTHTDTEAMGGDLLGEDSARKSPQLTGGGGGGGGGSGVGGPWSSFMGAMPARSLFAFGGGASTAAVATGVASAPSATIYFTQCGCGTSGDRDVADGQGVSCTCSRTGALGDHTANCMDADNHPSTAATASIPPVLSPVLKTATGSSSTATAEQLRPLYFLMKLAEQDNMADTTALILVPSLLTLLAVLDKPSQGFSIIADQLNLWVRCVLMFGGRMGGAYLAREIFTYKLQSRLRQQQSRGGRGSNNRPVVDDAAQLSNTHTDGISTRLWIQRLMLQDFHRHFWYLTIVTIVVTFACFERMEVPARFALLT